MGGLRRIAVTLCGAIFIVGVLSGVILTYASRTVFDVNVFSKRVADSLAEPPVTRVVAGQVTDQIVALRRDLMAFRPVVLGIVEQIVKSPPFRAVVQHAARKIHPILITHGESLSLTLTDLGVVVQEALSTNPKLAEKVPKKMQFVLGSSENWPTGKRLMAFLHVVERMQRRAPLWLALGFVMGGLGLVLARRRDQYLLRVGLGLALTSLVFGGVAKFGGSVLAGLTHSPIGSDLIRGLWPVFLGPLALRMLVLAGLGMVLAAAAAAMLERVDPAAILRGAWTRIWQRQASSAVLIARGAALVVVGALIVFQPVAALQILAVAAGAYFFFVGLQDVFVTGTRLVRPQLETAKAGSKARRSWLRVAIPAAVLLALIGAGTFWLLRDDGSPTPGFGPAAIVAVNGYPELRDRKLNEVVFPTTHNSMSAADIPNWMFPNQERGIREQLEDGVRGFLIDIHYGEPVSGRIKTLMDDEANARKKYEAVLGKVGLDTAMRIRDRLVGKVEGDRGIYLAHGFAELGATPFMDALDEVHDFMVENPNEVIVIVIQDEGVLPADVAAAFQKSGLLEMVYKGPVTAPWPTLGDMVARNERIVVYAENNVGDVPWYHLMGGNIQETPYGFHSPAEFSNRPNRGGKNGSLLLMNHWIETAPSSLPSNAQIVNAYDVLLKRARACRRERRMLPNLIAVDFYRTGDLFRVARALNGIPESDSVANAGATVAGY
jgi:hypothetical protein